ncbi:triosephosphate isomerase [Candidatus Berkelbacteria bacterium]|nr:triosephosphate isomerase [Candidatus Berkelbacteria bacterium]
MILAQQIKHYLEEESGVEVVICPPFPFIFPLADLFSHQPLNHLFLGAQNIAPWEEGAYTGEVSAKQLKGLVKYVIIGHSERRRFFGEKNQQINQKLKIALEYNLKPILAVGEYYKTEGSQSRGRPRKEEEAGDIIKQLHAALEGVPAANIRNIIIAYEPVWAIGTGEAASPAYTLTQVARLRKVVGGEIKVLYGGSVNSKNIAAFLKQAGVDGVLAATSTLKAKEFMEMVRIANVI